MEREGLVIRIAMVWDLISTAVVVGDINTAERELHINIVVVVDTVPAVIAVIAEVAVMVVIILMEVCIRFTCFQLFNIILFRPKSVSEYTAGPRALL